MTESRSRRARLTLQWPVVLGLTVLWMLLWGSISPLTILGGLLLAVVVLVLFPLPPVIYAGRVRPVKVVVLVLRFLLDMVVASVQVAWLALRPGPAPVSSIVCVPLRTRSELYLTSIAGFTSLVPGSLLVEVSRDAHTLHLHVIGADDEASVDRARRKVLDQERRILEAVASSRELEEYRAVVAREGAA